MVLGLAYKPLSPSTHLADSATELALRMRDLAVQASESALGGGLAFWMGVLRCPGDELAVQARGSPVCWGELAVQVGVSAIRVHELAFRAHELAVGVHELAVWAHELALGRMNWRLGRADRESMTGRHNLAVVQAGGLAIGSELAFWVGEPRRAGDELAVQAGESCGGVRESAVQVGVAVLRAGELAVHAGEPTGRVGELAVQVGDSAVCVRELAVGRTGL
jgi:hypothetical protein